MKRDEQASSGPPARRPELARPPGQFRDRESGELVSREAAFGLMSARYFKAQMRKAKGKG